MFRDPFLKAFLFGVTWSLLFIPLPSRADDPETSNETCVIREASAAAMARQAEQMAKQAEDLAKQCEQMAEHIGQQMEHILPQIEKQVRSAMNLAARMSENIPPVPPIPPIPPIPDIPKLPNFAHLGQDAEGEEAVETLEKTFEVQPGTALQVDSSFSSYRIQPGEDHAKMVFSIEKKTFGKTKEEAQKQLPAITITFEQTREAVILKIQPEKDQHVKLNGHCEVRILVPENTPIQLRNDFGDVNLEKLTGGVNLENKFGSAYVGYTKGHLNAAAEYGNLTIDAHEGPTKVRSQFGNTRFDALKGDLDVQTGYGQTFIDLDSPNARLTGTFSFGDIFVAIPADFSGAIEAVSSFGEIKAPAGLRKKKEMFNESVSGRLGGGEGTIKINSSYSPVTIEITDY